MISATLLFFLGGASVVIASVLLKKLVNDEKVLKENYRGVPISPLGGLIPVSAVLLCGGFLSLITISTLDLTVPASIFVIMIGCCLIGLIDDLVGDKSRQGFTGHLKELSHGNVTTGSLKMFAIPLIVFIALAPAIVYVGYWEVFLDVAMVAVLTNAFNLFDLAPGRCIKVMAISLIVALFWIPHLLPVYALLGVLAAFFVFDVREEFMLGDTGANALGALVSTIILFAADNTVKIIILIVALVLNIVSEKVSFSKIITGFMPLRLFDELGQTRQRKAWLRARGK
jgi:UDP-N-acetylmuramyl pentapeptide phosphotransferase/UDP-N-acetylglucosamine-1-phosphate transferase